jgi:integrase
MPVQAKPARFRYPPVTRTSTTLEESVLQKLPKKHAPARPRVLFTDAMLRRLRYDPRKADKADATDARMVVRDSKVPILEVRVTPAGTKTFYAVFRPAAARIGKRGNPVTGATKRLRIGEYHPDTGSLDAARKQATAYLLALQEKRDPHAEQKANNVARFTNTFDSTMQRFVEQALKAKGLDGKPNVLSWRNAERVLELHVLDHWRGKPVADIRRADVHELIDGIVADGALGTARDVRKHLHRMFNWAVSREIVQVNPLHGMEFDGLDANTEAGRELTDADLRAVWHSATEQGYPFGPWAQLLMLTGQRRADWANARRSEIEGDRRVLAIPAERYKGSKKRKARKQAKYNHVVPLADAAWGIVEKLPVFDGNDYYVFSTRKGTLPISGFSKAKADLDAGALAVLQKTDAAATLENFRVHDFRVTCRTRMEEKLHVPEAICEAVLGHTKQGLEAIYNKAEYVQQKRDALVAYAEHLAELVK